MGKEITGAKRCIYAAKAKENVASRPNIQKELSKQWTCNQGVVSKLELAEDGHAVVIIRTKLADTTAICKGLANEGNNYYVLTRLLRLKGLIAKQGRPGVFFTRKGFVWETVDVNKDSFRSGDCLMLIVNRIPMGIKKVIKHIETNNS